MRKIIILSLFSLFVSALSASAQTSKDSLPASKDSIPVFSMSDTASFTGKYKMEGVGFEYMEVNVKDGKLFYSGGEYNGSLDPVKDKKDAFDASGAATFTFLRNKENKVTDLKIDYQGQSYMGKREEKKG